MINRVIVKDIGPSDIESYKKFLQQGLVNDEENFRITPQDDLNEAFPTKDTVDSFTLGAYFTHQLAGVVSFERDGKNREKLRHKGILFRMYISPEYRGKGIAGLLLEAVILRVKNIPDIEQINLTVVDNNDRAKSLYEKYGFTTFASEKNAIKWKGKYFTENQMVLRIK